MNRRRFALMSLASMAWLAGCSGGDGGSTGMAGRSASPGSAGVLDLARANGAVRFLQAVDAADLEQKLSAEGPFTLFVPTDAAFRAAGISAGGDGDALRRVVGYHVVPGQIGSSFMRGMEMNHLTSAGDTVRIDGRSEPIRVNGARILRQDLVARNGVVHVIDQVLRAS